MARFNFEDLTYPGVAESSLTQTGIVNAELQGEDATADELFERGRKYAAGRDVEPDMIEAHKWFNLSAMRGNAEAKTYRMELAREMTRREVAQAQREAREWLKRH